MLLCVACAGMLLLDVAFESLEPFEFVESDAAVDSINTFPYIKVIKS